MVRVLFTVALLVAVAAVAFPAVDVASVDRAESQTQGAVDRLIESARALADANDALAGRDDAARQAMAVDLPNGGFASVRLASLIVRPAREPAGPISGGNGTNGTAPATTRIAWRVEGGRQHVTQVDGLRIRGADGGAFELERGGRQRLVLRLVERDVGRVVTIEPEGSR